MSPNRGWVLILVGLLISSFFGGAIHVLLSPDRVTSFVDSLVKKYEPKFTIQFQSARLRLSEGWEPTVAIELDDVTIKAKDPCITGSKIQIDHVIVPFDMIPLIVKKIRFGDVYAHQLRFYWLPRRCDSGVVERSAASVNDTINLLQSFFHSRWNFEIANTAHLLQGLDIAQFKFFTKNKTELFHADHFRASFDVKKHEADIQTDLQLGRPWVGQVPFGDFRLSTEVTAKRFRIEAHGNLKEGQIAVDSIWNIETGGLNVQSKFTDLPVQRVLDFANHWGALSAFHPTLHDEWLSCGLLYNGDIRAISHGRINASDCRMYGDLGNWLLKTPYIDVQKPFPIDWELANIDVQKWLNGFNVGSTWGVVGNFGKFSGNISIAGANKLKFGGKLKGFSAYIASQRNRAKLKISSLKLKMTIHRDQVSGKLANMNIEDGRIGGNLTYQFSLAGMGQIKFALNHVRLPLTVQNVLWNGQIGESSLSGTLMLKQFQFSQFDGDVGLTKLKVQPPGPWPTLLSNLVTSRNTDHVSDAFHWDRVKAHLMFSSNGGFWKELVAQLAKSKIFVRSSGSWTGTGQMTGRVYVHNYQARRRAQMLRMFSIGGTWQNPQLEARKAH